MSKRESLPLTLTWLDDPRRRCKRLLCPVEEFDRPRLGSSGKGVKEGKPLAGDEVVLVSGEGGMGLFFNDD
jgi:hypothetical protein